MSNNTKPNNITGGIDIPHKVFAQLSAQSYESRGDNIPDGWSIVFSSDILNSPEEVDSGYFGRGCSKWMVKMSI